MWHKVQASNKKKIVLTEANTILRGEKDEKTTIPLKGIVVA